MDRNPVEFIFRKPMEFIFQSHFKLVLYLRTLMIWGHLFLNYEMLRHHVINVKILKFLENCTERASTIC
jgi:hypothetical protein